jgi:hypothetical protein
MKTNHVILYRKIVALSSEINKLGILALEDKVFGYCNLELLLKDKGKSKEIPLQTWKGPEYSVRL